MPGSASNLTESVPVADPGEAPAGLADGLLLHRVDPLNFETTLAALGGSVVTPSSRFYVRSHFSTPKLYAKTWRLRVGGLVERSVELGLRTIVAMPPETRVVTLECAGNGRYALSPPVDGEQWQLGAVSTAEWTGIPLKQLLDRAGARPQASHVLFRGADQGSVGGREGVTQFERSLPVEIAHDPDVLLAYGMNGEPLPVEHGYPLRLVVPGWYGVASVKWLTDIELADHPSDGYYQQHMYWYETEAAPREPVTLQRVRAIITTPVSGDTLSPGEVTVRGTAWSGAAAIERVDVSINEQAWQPARLIGHADPHHWQCWELRAVLTSPGPTSLRARATDRAGRSQPDTPPWNKQGYGNNAVQQVDVVVS